VDWDDRGHFRGELESDAAIAGEGDDLVQSIG